MSSWLRSSSRSSSAGSSGVHPGELGWALRTARPTDFILLAAAAGQNGDPIDLSEKSGRAIFILEERVKERLGLTSAPVIVAQAGTRLVLTEYGPQSLKAPKETLP